MDIDEINKQINKLNELLCEPDVDVSWSSYDTVDQAINDLQTIHNGICAGEIESIDKLKFLLAPTGDFQEISISSGWADDFLAIAEAIEVALL